MSKQNRARTRAIRQRMAETGEPYSQAARTISDTGAPVRTDDRLSIILRTLLAEKSASSTTEEAEIAKEETQGHRIVTGGQTGPTAWEIIDWRTRQIIEQSSGGGDSYEQAMERLDPNGTWVHIDVLRDEQAWTAAAREHLPGIPDSLVEAIDDWVEHPRTPPDEIAALVGWTEQQVTEHLKGFGEG